MTEPKKGLSPWPTDPAAFVAQAKREGRTCTWDTERKGFYKDSATGKGDTLVVERVEADKSDLIFFGLPFAAPKGMPYREPRDPDDPESKLVLKFKQLESIEGVQVKWLTADVDTDCGVYLRTDTYEVKA